MRVCRIFMVWMIIMMLYQNDICDEVMVSLEEESDCIYIRKKDKIIRKIKKQDHYYVIDDLAFGDYDILNDQKEYVSSVHIAYAAPLEIHIPSKKIKKVYKEDYGALYVFIALGSICFIGLGYVWICFKNKFYDRE